MQVKLILAVIGLLICSACSVKVAPIASETGTVNYEDQSITEVRDGIAFTVKLDSLSYAPYLIVDNITSFKVRIENRNEEPALFPSKAFVIKDGSGRQYHSISPERVREIVSKDTVYLIPYPYVGYYYLEDQAKMAHLDTFTSSMPFFAEYRPQEIFTNALPEEPIMANSKIAGLVYFVADLEATNFADLLVFTDGKTSGEPLAKFSFAIEK